jgi:hypothetical protein
MSVGLANILDTSRHFCRVLPQQVPSTRCPVVQKEHQLLATFSANCILVCPAASTRINNISSLLTAERLVQNVFTACQNKNTRFPNGIRKATADLSTSPVGSVGTSGAWAWRAT